MKVVPPNLRIFTLWPRGKRPQTPQKCSRPVFKTEPQTRRAPAGRENGITVASQKKGNFRKGSDENARPDWKRPEIHGGEKPYVRSMSSSKMGAAYTRSPGKYQVASKKTAPKPALPHPRHPEQARPKLGRNQIPHLLVRDRWNPNENLKGALPRVIVSWGALARIATSKKEKLQSARSPTRAILSRNDGPTQVRPSVTSP